MTTKTLTKTETIALHNDTVRGALAHPEHEQTSAQLGLRFKLVWTPGIEDAILAKGAWRDLMHGVADFADFSEDNNPHGERDFAAMEVAGTRIFWKFDYYNLTLDGGSEDPADPAQTVRVLTLMLPSEY